MWPFHSSPKSSMEPMLSKRPEQQNVPLGRSLADNITKLQTIFANCSDVTFHELTIGEEQLPAQLLFVNVLADSHTINENVLNALKDIRFSHQQVSGPNSLDLIKKGFLEVGQVSEVVNFDEVADALLTGSVVLLLDGKAKALKLATKGVEARQVSEPITEGVVRGPREGFTETLRTNTALLRRKIKSANLKMEKFVLGRVTQTEVNVAYLEGIVNPKVVTEVRQRLSGINVDSVLESAYIEELIEDTPFTLLPLIQHSERPDKVAAEIISGRVAIFTDGTPFVLLVPTLMVQFLQSSEDYYERYPFALMVRLVRLLFLNIALLLPAVYIAITTFHQEMLPTPLLTSIATAHEGIPFPTVVEVFIMEITFEALREAGIRLPRPVGQAVSIVGALVIGQAAVQAKIVSPATVIVVAMTGIASFSIPSYNFGAAIRLLRFGMMLLGSILGMYGILLGMLVFQAHVVSLRSFGIPYLSPLAPFNLKDFKDVIVRFPWWAMGNRPRLLGKENRRRQEFFLKPDPSDKNRQ